MKADRFFHHSLILILLVGILPWMSCHRQFQEEKQINLVFRFDDYSALSATALEINIIDTFRKRDSSITFSVIPYVTSGDVHNPDPQDRIPLDATKGALLKTAFEEGVVDIALHGYSHQTNDAEHWSEFTGLDNQTQREKLIQGKALLEEMIDAPVTIFIPPLESIRS